MPKALDLTPPKGGGIHNCPKLTNNGRKLPTISYSEIATFNACRMKHHFVYKRQLERQLYDAKPIFGSMGHAALEAMYAGFDWRDHLADFTEHEIKAKKVFEDDEELFWQMADMIEVIVDRYQRHYAREDAEFETIRVEQKFEVILPATGRALAGFWDVLLRDKKTGRYWIRDYKFVGGKVETLENGQLAFKGGGQFRNVWELDMDIQLALYQWAGLELGIDIAGTIYDQIKAAIPKKPNVNKDGKGMSRQDIMTDWETYEAALIENGLNPDDYGDMAAKLAGKEWFRRTRVIRQPEEIAGIIADVVLKVNEIRQDPLPTFSPSRMNCGGCQFRDLCGELIRGRDIESWIADSYQPRSRREDGFSLPDLADEEDDEDYE